MPNLEDYKPEKRFCGLFVGDSGSGKSGAAASFPGPFHEIDTDGRFGGIVGCVKQGWLKGDKISFQQFDRLGGWIPIDKHLQQLVVYKMMAKSNQSPFPYETIEWASLGSTYRIILHMAKEELKGKSVGTLRLKAPGDDKVTTAGMHTIIDYMKTMPCNVIFSGHLIEKWGKDHSSTDDYAPNVVVGEKLCLTDNLAASAVGEFDNVFRFSRRVVGKDLKFFVEFAGELAKNSYGLSVGEHEITGKPFFPFFMSLVEKMK